MKPGIIIFIGKLRTKRPSKELKLKKFEFKVFPFAMLEALIILLLMLAIITGIIISPLVTAWRRNRLNKKLFPVAWLKLIAENIKPYHQLSPFQQKQLQGNVQILLAEKQFLGCGGLKITEEMKVLITAQASLLLLNNTRSYFPNLRTILVYPGAYIANQRSAVISSVVEERQVVRLGESWSRDQVVLSWQHIEQDIHSWRDGRNLVLHEFTHQLDSEEGKTAGVPILSQSEYYRDWSIVMSSEYQQLCQNVAQGRKIVIDAYGATNPAEFFAVATETFFEKPQRLQKKHPDLYRLLQRYYQLDPVQWR